MKKGKQRRCCFLILFVNIFVVVMLQILVLLLCWKGSGTGCVRSLEFVENGPYVFLVSLLASPLFLFQI